MQIERIYKPNTANNNKASKTGTGKKPYEAFDSTGKPSPYTEIRCVLQPSQSPQSRFFMARVFSVNYDDAFTLLYSFMAVEVKGATWKKYGEPYTLAAANSSRSTMKMSS